LSIGGSVHVSEKPLLERTFPGSHKGGVQVILLAVATQ
jgi:hypothetical protein